MAVPFEVSDAEGRKQRVYNEGKNAEDYHQYLSLTDEAIAFVGTKG